MYTATWPKKVRKIASNLLVTLVNIGNVYKLVANKFITQIFYWTRYKNTKKKTKTAFQIL